MKTQPKEDIAVRAVPRIHPRGHRQSDLGERTGLPPFRASPSPQSAHAAVSMTGLDSVPSQRMGSLRKRHSHSVWLSKTSVMGS